VPYLSAYVFLDLIDPAKQFPFVLHGKIFDQRIPAIIPDYREYENFGVVPKQLNACTKNKKY